VSGPTGKPNGLLGNLRFVKYRCVGPPIQYPACCAKMHNWLMPHESPIRGKSMDLGHEKSAHQFSLKGGGLDILEKSHTK